MLPCALKKPHPAGTDTCLDQNSIRQKGLQEMERQREIGCQCRKRPYCARRTAGDHSCLAGASGGRGGFLRGPAAFRRGLHPGGVRIRAGHGAEYPGLHQEPAAVAGGKESTLERAVSLYNKALKDVAAKAQAKAEGKLRLKPAPEAKQESGLRLGGKRQYSTQSEVLATEGINLVPNKTSVKQQLIDHAEELNSMDPLVEVEYAGETGTTLINLVMQEVPRVGGELMKRDSITLNFGETGASRIVHHAADNDEILAASLAAPYVAKYGKLIAGQKNHENQGVTTLTYAAPIIINGTPANEGVIIQFTNKGRPRAVNLGLQSGKPVRITKKRSPQRSRQSCFPNRERDGSTHRECF